MDNIIIEKIWEDIDFFEVKIRISSGYLQTSATVYVTESSIKELSQILRNFSQKEVTSKSELFWEEGQKEEDTYYISIRRKNIEISGRIVIEFYIQFPSAEKDSFCQSHITVEPGVLDRFIKEILGLAKSPVGAKIYLQEDEIENRSYH